MPVTVQHSNTVYCAGYSTAIVLQTVYCTAHYSSAVKTAITVKLTPAKTTPTIPEIAVSKIWVLFAGQQFSQSIRPDDCSFFHDIVLITLRVIIRRGDNQDPNQNLHIVFFV